ncbi:MAG: insulinase family protein [Bacilli bacterium]|nr:insulinase family protein [Clostridium sp.]MDY2803914.1 insulinase family protein [Bacilli bacterium]
MNKAKFITLDNGLTILIYTDSSKSTNHVELYTFFGGNNGEYVDYNGNTRSIKPGTAHLLEHYICENTVEGNLLDNLRKYNILSCNGGTNNENTSYFFNTVTNFYECLETFLRGIYNISFTKEKLDKTKMAVYSEIRDDKNNEKNKIIEKKINGLFTINRKTLGSSSSVKSITIKEIKDVYDNIYIPCNQFLVLAGNFDYDKTFSLVKNIYKEISFKNDKRLSKVSDVKNVIKKRTIYKSDYIDEVILTFKIDVSSLSCFDKYKLDWYLSFFLDINFSKYSKINEYINSCSDYVDDISAYLYYFNGYFVIDVIAFTKKVNEFEKLVLSSIKNRDSNEREVFELVKKDAITRISVRKDSISNYVAPTEENYIRFGYLDDDDIDVIDKFNYSEYDKIISNIDFTNYSVFYRKKK